MYCTYCTDIQIDRYKYKHKYKYRYLYKYEACTRTLHASYSNAHHGVVKLMLTNQRPISMPLHTPPITQ